MQHNFEKECQFSDTEIFVEPSLLYFTCINNYLVLVCCFKEFFSFNARERLYFISFSSWVSIAYNILSTISDYKYYTYCISTLSNWNIYRAFCPTAAHKSHTHWSFAQGSPLLLIFVLLFLCCVEGAVKGMCAVGCIKFVFFSKN